MLNNMIVATLNTVTKFFLDEGICDYLDKFKIHYLVACQVDQGVTAILCGVPWAVCPDISCDNQVTLFLELC